MPTLDEWQDWVRRQGDGLVGAEVLQYLFEERPGWLPQSDVEEGTVALFQTDVIGVAPLRVSAVEECLIWGAWRGRYWEGQGYRARNVALRTIRTIERIQRGELERVIGRLMDGRIASISLSESGCASIENERNLTGRRIQRLEVSNWLTGTRRIRRAPRSFPPQ